MDTTSNRPFAVVTGASTGIGFELARQCVRNGFDVLVCADEEEIERAAAEIGLDGSTVTAVRADLGTYEGCEQLVQAIADAGRPVDALLLNAGIGVGGAFLDNDLDEELRAIALNCAAVVHIAKRVVPGMVARGSGRVLVTASIVSTTPTPYLAVYGATKAFDLSFAEALRCELENTGVTVTALRPGATRTRFFQRAHMQDTRIAHADQDDPAEVARQGFEAMMAGKATTTAASLKSKLLGLAHEVMPESMKARAQAKQMRPGSARTHH
jgi:short-subunit dehydrogenase